MTWDRSAMASGVALSGEGLDTPVVCWGITIALADLLRVLLGLLYLRYIGPFGFISSLISRPFSGGRQRGTD